MSEYDEVQKVRVSLEKGIELNPVEISKITKVSIRQRQGNRSLLDIALTVHSTTTGAFERNLEDQIEDVNLLKDTINSWEPNRCTFDESVFKLIQEAIIEYERF